VTLTANSSAGNKSLPIAGTGIAPAALSVTIDSTPFDSVVLGTEATATVTFTNTGGLPLTLSSASLTSATGAFTWSTQPAADTSLAAGQAVTGVISFVPAAAGADSARIVADSSVGGQQLTISGTGVTPADLGTDWNAVPFSSVPRGAQATTTVTLTNRGGVPLTLHSTTISSLTGAFTWIAQPAAETQVAPGQVVTAVVAFTPIALGNDGAQILVDSSTGRQVVELGGTGVVPGLLVTIDQSPLAGVLVGEQATATVVVTNFSGLAVTLDELSISHIDYVDPGPFPPPTLAWATAPAAGTLLAPGQSVTGVLVFGPTFGGEVAAMLTASSFDAGFSTSVSFFGRGVVPGWLTPADCQIDFGNVTVGQSEPMPVTFTNPGDLPLTITSVISPAAPFSATDLPGSSLGAGQSVTSTVTFAPTAVGPASGTLTVVSAAGAVSCAFTGAGAPPPFLTIPDPVAGGWTFNNDRPHKGVTQLLDTTPGSLLQLTDATGGGEAGSAFWPTAVPSANITAAFDITIGGGTGGADGMTFILADPSRGATPASVGSQGSGLGFSGIPGVAVGFVTFWQTFVGLSDGGQLYYDPHWLVKNTAVPPLRNNGAHHVVVTTSNGTVTVTLDGAQVLSQAVALPPSVLVGFSAGDGGYNDLHAVSNVVITYAP
jgi:hypothetical protein